MRELRARETHMPDSGKPLTSMPPSAHPEQQSRRCRVPWSPCWRRTGCANRRSPSRSPTRPARWLPCHSFAHGVGPTDASSEEASADLEVPGVAELVLRSTRRCCAPAAPSFPLPPRQRSTPSAVASRKSPRSIRVRTAPSWRTATDRQRSNMPHGCVSAQFDRWLATAHAAETRKTPLET
jgi:hypothetical protein